MSTIGRLRISEVAKAISAHVEAEPDHDPALGPGMHLLSGNLSTVAEAAQSAIDGLTTQDRAKFDRIVQERVKKLYRSLAILFGRRPRAEVVAMPWITPP